MVCKKCGIANSVKAGFISGEQRYRCKDCGCKYVPTRQRGKPEKDKLLAVWLYMHGLLFRAIAKLFRVTPKAVYDWVKAYAKANYVKPEPVGEAVVVELDEMWHFIHSKNKSLDMESLLPRYPSTYRLGVRRA